MNETRLKKFLLSLCLVISMVSAGFVGVLVFEGVTDLGGVVAVKTLYVGGTGPGNNSSIQEAMEYASPGDTIRVYAGTYFENGLLIDKRLNLIGNGSANTTIDAGGTGNVIKITADLVNVSGLKILNSGKKIAPDIDAGIALYNVENVTITDVNCSNNNFGIYLESSYFNNIMNNTCFSNKYSGILVGYYSNSNNIYNNSCKWNGEMGIFLSLSDLNTVRNNSCNNNFQAGMLILESDFNILINNTCNFNNWSGISLQDSHSNTMEKNFCTFNNNQGIYFFQSHSNSISYSSCSSNAINGIYLQLSDFTLIENTICNFNVYNAIQLVQADFSIIVNNSCNSLTDYGIYILGSISNTIRNNTLTSCGLALDGVSPQYYNTHTIDNTNSINGKPIYYWKFQTSGIIPSNAGQVILANCTNVQINDQSLTYCSYPIQIFYSNSNIITNNILSNNYEGIFLLYSDNNLIEKNSCNSNMFFGIRCLFSDQNTIINNSCTSNQINGISIFSSNNNTMANNTFSNNDANGIYLYISKWNFLLNNTISGNNKGVFLNFTSNKNTIRNNYISSNDVYGIYILDSNNNIIFYNNIKDNVAQGVEVGDSSNQWDNGDSEGNYWSDYSGLDDGSSARNSGDGIGDSNLKHLSLDNYPFMNRSGWLYPGIPRLVDPGEVDTDGNYTISWNDNRATLRYILEEDYYVNQQFMSSNEAYNGSALAYQVTNRPNGTYKYRLKAVGEYHESPWSNIVEILVDWPPIRPQEFKVSVYLNGNALNLTWDANNIDTDEYYLEFKNDTITDWELHKIIKHPDHFYNHTGLNDGENYHYRLQAKDIRGQFSNYSEIGLGVPQDSVAPAPPTGFSVVDAGSDWIKLTWEPNIEEDVAGYFIYQENRSKLIDPWDLIGITQENGEEYIVNGLVELTEYRFVIIAFDEVPNNSSYSDWTSGNTTLGPHKPSVNATYNALLTNFKLNEDTYDDSINLYKMFIDSNHDIMTFQSEGQNHLNITIFQNNGTVIIRPDPNWFGEENITFYANDTIFEASNQIAIIVTSVNDAPGPVNILTPKEGYKVNETEDIEFTATCGDPDLEINEMENLTFKWSSNLDGELGLGDSFQAKLTPGNHVVTLTVTDREGLSAIATVNIEVLSVSKPSADKETSLNLMLIGLIGIIIVIVLILILFFILAKKKESARSITDEKVAEPGTVMVAEQKEVIVSEGIVMTQMQPPIDMPSQIPIPPSSPYDAPGTMTGPIPSQELVTPEMAPAPPGQAEAQTTPQISDQGFPKMPIQTPIPELPSAPPQVPTEVDHTENIEWGRAYIIVTKESEFGRDIFEKLVIKGTGQGLSITRTHPSKLPISSISDDVKKIWLSKTPEADSISPGNITKLAHVISEYLKEGDNNVILLDGIEYLINNNDFPKILKFIEMVHERIVLDNGLLLIPINPFTLSSTDFEILEKELTNTIKDPTYASEKI